MNSNKQQLMASAELRDRMIVLASKFNVLSGKPRSQVIARWNELNEKITPMYEKEGSIDIVAPQHHNANNYFEIKTFRYSDGKYSYGLNVNISGAGMGFRFHEYKLCDTKEQAVQGAINEVLRWVNHEERGCTKSNKVIIDMIKNSCSEYLNSKKYQQLAFL